MNVIEIGNIRRELPSSWNELSRKQLLLVASLFHKGITVVDFKVKLLFAFLGLKKKTFFKISPEDAYFVGETLSFLLKETTLTRNTIRYFYIRSRRFWGPEDEMKNCTFEEFVHIQSRLEAYRKDKSDNLLQEITAILFRRRRFAWWIRKHFTEGTDPRVPFSEKRLGNSIVRMKKTNQRIHMAIFLFVNGVMESIPAMFPNLYRKRDDYTSGSSGWVDLVIGLADGKTDNESLELVMKSNMYNVLFGMEKSAREYYEFKSKNKIND